MVHSRCEGLAWPQVYGWGRAAGEDQRQAAGWAELSGTVHGRYRNDAVLLPLENSGLLNLPAFSLRTLQSIGSVKKIQYFKPLHS